MVGVLAIFCQQLKCPRLYRAGASQTGNSGIMRSSPILLGHRLVLDSVKVMVLESRAMNIHSFYSFISKRYRKGRIARFKSVFRGGRVVDFGGSAAMWDQIGDGYDVTLLNNFPETNAGKCRMIIGDGCRAPFASKSYDMAFSNSAIEHVATGRPRGVSLMRCNGSGAGFFAKRPTAGFQWTPTL